MDMKKLIFLLAITAHTTFAQNYTVGRVVGQILDEKGHKLAVGVNLSLGQTLSVDNPAKSKLILIQGKQRFSVQLKAGAFQLTRALLKPIARTSFARTRSLSAGTLGVSNLSEYFGNDRFEVIGDEIQIKVNPSQYQLSPEKVMVYRFEYAGETIQKQIPNDSANKIILNKRTIHNHKNTWVEASEIKNPKLFYFDKNKRESRELVSFYLEFLDEAALKEDLRKLVANSAEFQSLKGEALLDELCVFFFDVYGKTDLLHLRNWLQKNVIP